MVSLVKLFGAVSGIVSIQTHLKGAFGFNGFLGPDFLFVEDIWYDVQKRSVSILSSISLSQYKEYNPSSLCVVPSSNDTYYTTLMGLKLTKY